MKHEIAITPKQLRALVLLLLLIPLVPSAALLGSLHLQSREAMHEEREAFVNTRRQEFETVLDRLERRGDAAGARDVNAPNDGPALADYFRSIFGPGVRVAFRDGAMPHNADAGARGARSIVDESASGGPIRLSGPSAERMITLEWDAAAAHPVDAVRERRRALLFGWALVGGACGLAAAAGWTVQRQLRDEEMKSDFLASVGHELKTPVASMRLLVDTLREGRALDDEDQRREYLGMLASEIQRLQDTIGNFLTAWRLQHRLDALDMVPLHPYVVVRSAVDQIQPKAEAARGVVTVRVRPDATGILGDRRALITVLTNLLDNAVKYSDRAPRIRVDVFASGGSVFFQVADEGIGVPPEHRRRIFDRFYRVDERLSRRGGGCGLGLAIAKSVVEAHGGEIGVLERRGRQRGSLFWFRVPASGAVDAGRGTAEADTPEESWDGSVASDGRPERPGALRGRAGAAVHH